MATSIPVLLAMRLLTGVGDALFFVAALSANVDLAPEDRRGEAMSFASLSLYVGIGAGPFIGEALIAWHGFEAAWVTAIALAAAAVVLALRLPAMRPAKEGMVAEGHRLVHHAGLLRASCCSRRSGAWAASWRSSHCMRSTSAWEARVWCSGCSRGSSSSSEASAPRSRTGSGRVAPCESRSC